MRRALRILARAFAALAALVMLALIVVIVALNTDPGRRFAERLTAHLTGGLVTIDGLSGAFPSAPRIARIEIHDAQGTWLTVEDAALDWSPLRLLTGTARAQLLAARHVAVARLPVSSAAASSGGSSFSLPVRVDVARLRVDRLDIAAPVAGTPATLSAEGSARLASLSQGEATVALERLDRPGSYHLQGAIGPDAVQARAAVREPAQGLISQLAGLSDLGAIALTASADGPWTHAAARLAATVGALRADAGGTVDVPGETADIDVTASAPAMRPGPALAWQAIGLDAHLHGRFTAPDVGATLRVEALEAAGAGLRLLTAEANGRAGAARLTATAEGLRLPGPRPDVLAGAPLRLTAEARLDAPDRPVRFVLSHPLVTIQGTARTGGAPAADVTAILPELGPLAAAGGVDLAGQAFLAVRAAAAGAETSVDADGRLAVTGGAAPLPGLIGPDATLALGATLHGPDVTLRRLAFDGRALSAAAEGALRGGRLDLGWRLGLADLTALAPTLDGTLNATGRATGPTDDLAVTADLDGDLATQGFGRGPVKATLQAAHLPGQPTGTITAEGTLDDAPLALAAQAARAGDGALHVLIDRATWRSTSAQGTLDLPPGAVLPLGTLTLAVGDLGDYRPFVGQPITGSVNATLRSEDDAGTKVARLELRARDAGLPGTEAVGAATLAATVRDPVGSPVTEARLDVTGLQAGSIGGGFRLEANGPQDALALRLSSSLTGVGGADLAAQGAATLDAAARALSVASLQASWKGETLRLLGPARVEFADGVAVDRLRLGLRQAVLEVAGRVSPTLDLTAALRNVTADLARIVVPDLQAEGRLEADARLAGTPARPTGTVRIAATGMRLTTGAGAGLPAASLAANATLQGADARVDATLTAGRNRLAVNGTAPVDPAGALDLRANGEVDLATFNPILAAGGRHARGRLTLDAGVTGTAAAPRANGTLRLAGGSVQDVRLGARLEGIEATVEAAGDTIRIARFAARAGNGSLSAGGTVGLAAPMPLDLTLTAHNATPVSSDLLSAVLDGDLTLRGEALGQMAVAGRIVVPRAEIRIPERLPASLAVLDVRRPGQAPPPPPPPPPDIALDVTLSSPGQVFVRGRGIDAELAGDLHIGGTAATPKPEGGFHLRRGQFSLVGTTLDFTKGEVSFDGSGKIDPTLDFIATSANSNVTATLQVTGYASAPRITLSSVPELPQDEVLAWLLFHQSAVDLGPLQLAQIAAAVAQITGVGGGFDPLNAIRSGLGLDRLTVGSGQGGQGASLEAGRYVTDRVYVGAKQGTGGAGGGTQGVVQVDLLKGLKLEATVGQNQPSATGAGSSTDPSGTSVGIRYQFQY